MLSKDNSIVILPDILKPLSVMWCRDRITVLVDCGYSLVHLSDVVYRQSYCALLRIADILRPLAVMWCRDNRITVLVDCGYSLVHLSNVVCRQSYYTILQIADILSPYQ